MIMSGRFIHLTKYFTLHKFLTDISLLAYVKLRTGDFDNFWGVEFVLCLSYCFEFLPCGELVRFFSDVKNCMVLNFHKCEESVPKSQTCEESVPKRHICEELVANYHL